MNKLGLIAAAALAGMALPPIVIAQTRSNDGIDGGKPLQIEREPNTLNAPPVVPTVEVRGTGGAEARASRKAARARIAVRPRIRIARARRGE